MKEIIDILKELIPLWLAILAGSFIYILILYKRQYDEIQKSSKTLNENLQTHLDNLHKHVSTVDTATIMYERLIERQNKEMVNLKNNLELYKEQNKNQTVEELKIIKFSIEQVQKQNELILNDRIAFKGNLEKLLETRLSIQDSFDKIIEARNISQYQIMINVVIGSHNIIEDLQKIGYKPTYFLNLRTSTEVDEEKFNYDALSFGKNIDFKTIQDVTRVSIKHLPQIKYVFINKLDDFQNKIIIAANTSLLKGKIPYKIFETKDFEQLLSINTHIKLIDFLNTMIIRE